MKLQEQQFLFALDVAKLIQFAASQGLWITLDEAYRTPEQAALNAAKGIGIADSLHCKRLAVDINLYRDGVYLFKPRDYYALATFWESLGKQNRAGYFFTDAQGKSKPDARHFERKQI